jgi:hypothetical protein
VKWTRQEADHLPPPGVGIPFFKNKNWDSTPFRWWGRGMGDEILTQHVNGKVP